MLKYKYIIEIRFTMTYVEFKECLNIHNLTIKKVASEIGYSTKSIENNWSKIDKIPKRAKLALDMYLKILNLQKEYNQELNSQCFILSHSALKIAENKCKEKEISLNEYLSSLIIANT